MKAREYPDALPAMRCANVGRSHHIPLRIVPERGKVAEDDPEPSIGEGWRVFDEREGGSNLVDDARHLSPESRLVAVDPCPAPGDADVLTGKAARYDVNTAAPCSSVKSAHVVPDRERGQGAIVLPCHEYGRCIGIRLNCAYGPPSEQVPPENASTSACE
jgi:hypothetical protein